MRSDDTSLGGSGARFPSTTWGRARQALDMGDPQVMESLCRRYWKPIYRYLRIRWSKSNDDAKDLVQAFFLWLFERGALARYDAGRASFRTYLQLLLNSFVGHQQEALQALKRGGGKSILSLDNQAYLQEQLSTREKDDDRLFDRLWVAESYRIAIDRVRKDFDRQGKAVQFQAYAQYELAAEESRPTYAEIAASLGVKESDVRNSLFAVRAAVREALRAELADLADGTETFKKEWTELFPG